MSQNNDDISLSAENAAINDKVTAIRKLVRSMELRYAGYEWNSQGESFSPTGKVLLGEELIQKATGLLQPFCEEANLITVKDIKTMARQKFHTSLAFLDSCLVDMGCPDYNYKVVFQIFKNTMQNIADIIMNSRGYMVEIFGSKPEVKNPEPMTDIY